MNSKRFYPDPVNAGQRQSGSPASLDQISRALDELESHLSELSHGPALARGFARLRRHEEEAAPVGEPASPHEDFRQLIHEELGQEFQALRRDLTDTISAHPAFAEAAQLTARLEQLTDAVAGLAQRSDATTSAALHERLEEIAQAVNNLPDSFSLRMLDERVRLLASALNELLTGTLLGDPEHYARIDDRLDEISRAIATLTACARTAQLDPEPFERIEARIASLVHQVSDLLADQPDREDAQRIHAQMNSLSLRVDEIAQRVDMPEQMVERLVEQATRLEQWLNDPEDGAALRAMEARLEDISERLDPPAGLDEEAIRRLEAQVKNLSEQLAQPGKGVQGSRDSAPRDDSEAQRLCDALKALEASTRKSDERNTKTFEAIHDTLLKIVDRIGSAEPEIETSPDRHQAETKIVVAAAPSIDPEGGATGLSASSSSEAAPEREAEEPDQTHPKHDAMPVASALEIEPEPVIPPRDLNAVMRRLRGDSETPSPDNDVEISRSDFIAAARRAAQAAAAEAEITKNRSSGAGATRDGLGRFLKRASAPAALFIGAGVALYGGINWGPALFAGDDAATVKVEEAATPASNATTKPAPEKPAASADAVKTQNAERRVRVLDKTSARRADEAPGGQAATPHQQQAGSEQALTDQTVTSSVSQDPFEIPGQIAPAPLRKAAAERDPRALYEIGDRYAEGRGVETDPVQARRWFERSANLGFAPAQYRLGTIHQKGLGVAPDAAKAGTWFKRAATQGNTLAMHNLGLFAATGANGAPNHRAAARWFLEAAERGLTDSQFNLGILSAKGMGVAQDLEEAYKWFDLVAMTGDKEAEARRDKIAEALTPQQLERAKGKAILWKAKAPDRDANIVDVPEAWSAQKAAASDTVMKQAIANIQSILNKTGYNAGPADGVLGEKTRSAITAFQMANGMTPDGKVDESLVRALLNRHEPAWAS